MDDISHSKKKFLNAFKNIKILSIGITYLYSFGLEITLITNIEALLKNITNFDLNRINLLLLIFSSINIVARPFGGYLCDKNYEKFKIIGKIKLVLFLILTTTLSFIILTYYIINFRDKDVLYNIILIILISLSFSNNLLQGTIIGIIPHLDSNNLGVILGIVSSFGTIGGIIGNILFINYNINSLIYINIFGVFTFISNTFILL